MSCYALFQGWLLLSQPPAVYATPHPFPLSTRFGTLDDGLGCLPLDDGAYPPPTHCRNTRQRYSEFGCCWYPTRARKHPVALPPRRNRPTLHLNAFRREPAITEFDWPFTPSPVSSPRFSTRGGFGPPRGLTRASTCQGLDHPASGPGQATENALFGLAFATHTPHGLCSPPATDSQTHFSIGTPSPHRGGSDGLWAHGFRNCFTPLGVLFTFPSRYWYAIGQTGMLRLTQRSGLIHAGFHEARATWDNTIGRRLTSGTGLAPSTAGPSSLFPGKPFYDSRPARRNGTRDPTTPATQPPTGITRNRFGLIRFRSPLLTEYPFLQVLRCFTSLRTPRP